VFIDLPGALAIVSRSRTRGAEATWGSSRGPHLSQL